MLVRVTGAMYSIIQDCDEGTRNIIICLLQRTLIYVSFFVVYNFWEPLHYLDRNYGFQTWELSPTYAVRSWAYLLLHFPFAGIIAKHFTADKVCIVSLNLFILITLLKGGTL